MDIQNSWYFLSVNGLMNYSERREGCSKLIYRYPPLSQVKKPNGIFLEEKLILSPIWILFDEDIE